MRQRSSKKDGVRRRIRHDYTSLPKETFPGVGVHTNPRRLFVVNFWFLVLHLGDYKNHKKWLLKVFFKKIDQGTDNTRMTVPVTEERFINV